MKAQKNQNVNLPKNKTLNEFYKKSLIEKNKQKDICIKKKPYVNIEERYNTEHNINIQYEEKEEKNFNKIHKCSNKHCCGKKNHSLDKQIKKDEKKNKINKPNKLIKSNNYSKNLKKVVNNKDNKIKKSMTINNNENNIVEKVEDNVEVIFNYNNIETTIQTKMDETMQNVINKFIEKARIANLNKYYVYNAKIIKENLSLTLIDIANEEDKKRKKLNILVTDMFQVSDNIENEEVISKDFVCHECYENILLIFKNYKVSYSCKNNHTKQQLSLSEYEKLQKINIKKIICGHCKQNTKYSSYQHDFYFCFTCNINLCPLCLQSHKNDNHIIINYDDKNYLCRKHNEKFIEYCEQCKENICFFCKGEHKEHKNLIDLQEMIIDKLEILNEMKSTGILIENTIKFITDIKNKFDIVLKNIEILYNVNKTFVENYDLSKRNYQLLKNILEIKKYNQLFMKDLDYFKSEESLPNKVDYIIAIYNKMNANNCDIVYPNGDRYIGEYKNNKRNGIGVMYYNAKDEKNRYSYEGDWKDDIYDGKGIMIWKNNDIYNGSWKNGLTEGKGLFISNNGDVYEGELKNGKKEGKGIYTFQNNNRYEGEFKNGFFDGKGIFYWNNGDKYIGEFKNYTCEGKGVIFYDKGEIELGIFSNGKKVGKYAVLDLNNKIEIKKGK